jgi:DNA-directed RNA polymerase specialized sigma subunit
VQELVLETREAAWQLTQDLGQVPTESDLARYLGVSRSDHELPRREQQILVMRFYGDMTQVQIGHQLGISQTQVSRLLAHALGYLRPRLLGLPGRELPARLS